MRDRDVLKEKVINLNGDNDYFASDSLVSEALEKGSDIYIASSYTDYGGSIIDKLFIEYMLREHPNNIITEEISWNGMNAFIFGDIAKGIETCLPSVLTFGDFREYCHDMILEIQLDEAEKYCEENNITDEKDIEKVQDFFVEQYVETFGVDYSETELEDYLKENV